MITGMGFYVDYVMMDLEEGMVDGGRSSPHGALCLVLVHLVDLLLVHLLKWSRHDQYLLGCSLIVDLSTFLLY